MRPFPILLLLALLIMPASAYLYHLPVNVRSSVSPEVLMPGDTGVVTIELENGAAQYGVAEDEARGLTLSTPVNKTTLQGISEIMVISHDYGDLGMIGPKDKVTLYYKIDARENISDGTYFLDFGVLCGYEPVWINRKIPVKVDSAELSLARADVSNKPSISLNVANPRGNTVNAVSIIPFADGIRFSPEEYYIGNMNPDEVFTISFGIDAMNPERPIKRSVNLSFRSKFKNGDTWHESIPYIIGYIPPKEPSDPRINLIAPAAAAILILLAGIYIYRRKRRQDKRG